MRFLLHVFRIYELSLLYVAVHIGQHFTTPLQRLFAQGLSKRNVLHAPLLLPWHPIAVFGTRLYSKLDQDKGRKSVSPTLH